MTFTPRSRLHSNRSRDNRSGVGAKAIAVTASPSFRGHCWAHKSAAILIYWRQLSIGSIVEKQTFSYASLKGLDKLTWKCFLVLATSLFFICVWSSIRKTVYQSVNYLLSNIIYNNTYWKYQTWTIKQFSDFHRFHKLFLMSNYQNHIQNLSLKQCFLQALSVKTRYNVEKRRYNVKYFVLLSSFAYKIKINQIRSILFESLTSNPLGHNLTLPKSRFYRTGNLKNFNSRMIQISSGWRCKALNNSVAVVIDGSHADRSCWAPIKEACGPPRPSVGSLLQPREVQRGKRESASEQGAGEGGTGGKSEALLRGERLGESLWPAVNCQHLMSALWRAARTAAVTLVMAGAFLTTALHDSSPFLSTMCTTMYQFSGCQCAFLSAFY